MLAYVLIFGSEPGRGLRRARWIIPVMVALQLAGYHFVYLITPHPVAWQLEFSLERLLLQVYLPVLFVLFTVLRDVSSLWAPGVPRQPPASAG